MLHAYECECVEWKLINATDSIMTRDRFLSGFVVGTFWECRLRVSIWPGIVTTFNERYTDARNKLFCISSASMCVCFRIIFAAVAKYKLIISELRKNEIRDHEAEALMYYVSFTWPTTIITSSIVKIYAYVWLGLFFFWV